MKWCQRAWPKKLKKMGYKKRFFFFIFDIYYATWKIVQYIMSYTDMHHFKNFIKIWAH